MQAAKLYDREKQKERYGAYRAEKVLPLGSAAYFASRNKIISPTSGVSVTTNLSRENRIVHYFRETFAELKKVNWPTREEAVNLTIVVVVTILVMSIFLGVFVDSIFSFLVRALIVPSPPLISK